MLLEGSDWTLETEARKASAGRFASRILTSSSWRGTVLVKVLGDVGTWMEVSPPSHLRGNVLSNHGSFTPWNATRRIISPIRL